MEEHTDFVEFDRPNGKKVRIVFELYRFEVLFHYCEFKHDENSDWQSIARGDDGYFDYLLPNKDGGTIQERIKFPTNEEIAAAQDEINKKYNILSI